MRNSRKRCFLLHKKKHAFLASFRVKQYEWKLRDDVLNWKPAVSSRSVNLVLPLRQAKINVIKNYMVVGVTEQMEDQQSIVATPHTKIFPIIENISETCQLRSIS